MWPRYSTMISQYFICLSIKFSQCPLFILPLMSPIRLEQSRISHCKSHSDKPSVYDTTYLTLALSIISNEKNPDKSDQGGGYCPVHMLWGGIINTTIYFCAMMHNHICMRSPIAHKLIISHTTVTRYWWQGLTMSYSTAMDGVSSQFITRPYWNRFSDIGRMHFGLKVVFRFKHATPTH